MNKPLFAPKWFQEAPPKEVRLEVLNIYKVLQDLREAVTELEAKVKALEESVGP